jgi:hypothetical protein
MMTKYVRLTLACALAVLVSASYAGAQTNANNRTTLTFSEPVEVPGMILPAGTYVFELHDSQMNRHVVMIYDKTGKDLLTSVLAVPDYRLKATSKTVIKFNEVKAGQPQAIRAWFYPGHTVGDELVYSKSRAHELAATSNVVVPATDDVVYVEKKVETMTAAPIVAVTPERKEEPLTIIQTTPIEAIAPTPAPRAELPHTAGNLPMITLLAFGMIAFGLTARRFATR